MLKPPSLLCLFIFFFLVSTPCFGLAGQEGAQAVIFMYHRFGESHYPSTNISLDRFEEQLGFFEENNFSVLPLEEIVQALKEDRPLPPRSIALTIDDAYLSVYTEAYPRLKARGYPFTVFVAPALIDKGIAAYMNWQQMEEMQQHGVTFANHSMNHDYLIRKREGESVGVWKERMEEDISGAQQRLREKLGRAPALFAYPYGEYNQELMEIVKNLGYTAFGQHSGGVNGLSNMAALPRFPVAGVYARMASFRTKAFSLAMVVLDQQPLEPVTTEKRPRLTVTLGPSSADLQQLACYLGNEAMAIKWLEAEKRFVIQAENDLPVGRSRYNCTAPDRASKRYFWYSHPWIRSEKQ